MFMIYNFCKEGIMKLGFVDVGGGTRGIYGAGIFDTFLENNIKCDYFIGVSAGAANGAAFLAGQTYRNYRFYNDYAFRKDYMSLRNFIRDGSYIDLEYVYSYLSNSDGQDPLDYESINANPSEFEIVTSLVDTGKAYYFEKDDLKKDSYDPIKASCCVPLLCKPYYIGDQGYFDGGLSDPIPYKRAFESGCDKLVVVLTRPKNDFRNPKDDLKAYRLLKKSYPKAALALKNRANLYNRSLHEILELEKEGKVIIIGPKSIGKLKTLTQDHDLLDDLYFSGRRDGKKAIIELAKFYNNN